MSEPGVVLRAFRDGDAAALHVVFHSAIHGTACADYTREQLEAWAPARIDEVAWAARMQRLQPFVAECAGEPVGYAALRADGYVDDFYVAATHGGRGIGTRLMAAVLERARQLGLTRLHSDVSVTAQRLFAKHGFRIVEQRMPVVRGVAMPNARMVREPLR